ncbi:hypothetical protein PV05_10731 [Exophiala xenobiotica]|uniref:Major facilitator superfamily (MFS) profile domain-containing protein n=1 Tax=Exophiala xenobiotica TaxID=348802 RepID=A0A0D2E2R9_9EURO|nr:uncharacterized protein PV05_10731 [Exophiala xenobiotica]KIW49015.1 hypothetical protein PV05_10731 [Exophiala xenobiotica]MBV36340.1 hypothetical protein [Rickettsiales bacterium]
MVDFSPATDKNVVFRDSETHSPAHEPAPPAAGPRKILKALYVSAVILLLFLNYFLAQFDKFVLSYFQSEVLESLQLTSTQYGILSGYAVGILYAVLAIPMAYIADYTEARVWVLSVAALWWSLCVLFQGYSHNFWQILLARIGMGIGQSPVEALSISLISDLVPLNWIFVCESVFYIGVYVGEAVSGQIATAFDKTNTPWSDALKAVGIVGMVLSVVTRVVLREPVRKPNAVGQLSRTIREPDQNDHVEPTRLERGNRMFKLALRQIVSMKSFWILALSSGARQFSGNVFGWYMPSYLSSIYPSQSELLSRYGIIVGVVGSVAVVLGGVVSSLMSEHATAVLYLTGIGGMVSAPFVICMVFSRSLAGGNEEAGVRILYGVMSAAYLTAELWLGAFASLLALLFPARTKTFCLAIYTSTIVFLYSSAPQIIGLALRHYEPGSPAYIEKTRDILAILIPVGYWVAGIGFLVSIKMVKSDIAAGRCADEGNGTYGFSRPISLRRKLAFGGFCLVLAALTVALLVTSLTVTD